MFELILTIAILRKKNRRQALGLLALLALTGCTTLQPRLPPEPAASSPARCEAWNGAELLWPLVDSHMRGVIAQQRQAACSAPSSPVTPSLPGPQGGAGPGAPQPEEQQPGQPVVDPPHQPLFPLLQVMSTDDLRERGERAGAAAPPMAGTVTAPTAHPPAADTARAPGATVGTTQSARKPVAFPSRWPTHEVGCVTRNPPCASVQACCGLRIVRSLVTWKPPKGGSRGWVAPSTRCPTSR